MPVLVETPVRVPVPGGKIIDEYAGRVATGDERVSVARMDAPEGWTEPAQRPAFDEITVVLRGCVRVEHDGEYAVVASLGGAPKHPVWYYNVKTNPHVELQDGTVSRDYEAREVVGDEKALWWDRAVAAFPDYAEYQNKTDRQIPVFVLTPMN